MKRGNKKTFEIVRAARTHAQGGNERGTRPGGRLHGSLAAAAALASKPFFLQFPARDTESRAVVDYGERREGVGKKEGAY